MSFVQKEVCQMTGLKPRQVLYFTERGLITAHVEETSGSGHYRLYGLYNVFEFLIIKELVGYGVSLSKIREVVDMVRPWAFPLGTEKPDPLTFDPSIFRRTTVVYIMSDGDCFMASQPDSAGFHMRSPKRSFLCLNIGRIAEELQLFIKRRRV